MASEGQGGLMLGSPFPEQEDREVESLTTPPPPAGISPGITVITAPPELQETSLPKTQFGYLDVAKASPSPGLLDRSDDDDSDHGGGDIYAQHMKGRVSPSPYTANTERARQFNTYVRGLIEERLDTLIPISHQPRDLIHQIIMDTSTRFPEFSSSVRKRIRTYLKSYRRSKRVKDMQAAAAIAYNVNGSSSTVTLPNGATTGPKVMKPNNNKDDSPLINIASISLPAELLNHKQNSVSPTTSAILSINSLGGAVIVGGAEKEGPVAKKPKLTPTSISLQPTSIVAPTCVNSNTKEVTASSLTVGSSTSNSTTAVVGGVGGGAKAAITTPVANNSNDLSNNEVSTLKQLIQGYRESAAFLNRAADQLEEMLLKEHPEAVL